LIGAVIDLEEIAPIKSSRTNPRW